MAGTTIVPSAVAAHHVFLLDACARTIGDQSLGQKRDTFYNRHERQSFRMSDPIRILCVEGHPALREELSTIIGSPDLVS